MNKKRILSMLLCVMMVVTLFTGMIPAASAADGESADNGLVTSKVYDPNTGKLTLEAYATGEVIKTVTDEPVPCDIVLVLDVSGSMEDRVDSTVYGTKSDVTGLDTSKPQGYYVAFVSGLATVQRYVRYSGGEWQYRNESGFGWTGIDDSIYRITIYKSKLGAMMDAVDSFVDTVAADANGRSVDHKIGIVTYSSSANVVAKLTSVDSGSSSLKNTVSALNADGATAADYGMTAAQDMLKDARADSNKVVVMFTDGEPNHGNGFSPTVANNTISTAKDMKAKKVTVYTVGVFSNPSDNVKNYMNGVSSNYPNATAYNNLGAGSDKGYFQLATSQADLSKIFTSIATESTSGGSHTTLDSKAYVKDVISDYFDLPEGADKNSIKVFTAPCTGDNAFGARTEINDANVIVNGKTISVSNFDFSTNWCGKDGSTYRGSKLIIEIPIIPVSDKIDAGTLPTNAHESGVYDGDDNPVENFPIPEITVAEKTYVIDYAQPLTVNSKEDWGQASITSIHDKVGSSNAPSMSYGTVSSTSSSITYTPNTMKWNGSDSLYSYQENGGTEHTWAKVNFVPANNVYYEDTFVSTDGTGIVYTGFTSVGTDANHAGTANTAETAGSGQNVSLNKDATYSNGSAHMAVASNDNRATASFTFTGRGVDVYSRTNGDTGTIFATIKGGSVNKAVSIDNKLQGKDFYQVPTLSFSGLDYDTYEVTIYVTTAAGADRATYYLDGIRVYNPADFNEDSSYPVSERNAQFTEVRDKLLKADAFSVDSNVEGAVFVDSVTPTRDAQIADYKAYGPENEVYLAKGQAIVFNVSEAGNYYVGLSAPEGGTNAKVTNGSGKSPITVGHASDLYYKVTPNSDGYIMIQNNGDNILAVSKLYTAGDAAASAPVRLRAMSYAPTMSYVNSFNTLSVVPYDNQTVDPDDSTDPTNPQPTSSIIKAIVDSLFRNIKNLFKWF